MNSSGLAKWKKPMSIQATFLRDGTIEIQTGDGDRLILTMEEARTFHTEIECALFSIFSDDQTDPENQIPIVVSEISLSNDDAEQLASRLDVLLNQEGREPTMRIDWLRLGY